MVVSTGWSKDLGLNEEEERVLKLLRDLNKAIDRWSFLWRDDVHEIEGFCTNMNVLFGQNMGLGKVPDIGSLMTIRGMLKRIDEKISVEVRYAYLNGETEVLGNLLRRRLIWWRKN